MGGISAAVSKTAAAPIERVKLLVQNQVSLDRPDMFASRLERCPFLDSSSGLKNASKAYNCSYLFLTAFNRMK